MLEVILLGTGALSPIPERALAAAVLTVSGRSLLFDCGEGTQTVLRKNHVSPMKLDAVALTHYHGDHLFGLPGLLQTMLQEERRTPLYVFGPPGLHEALAPVLTLAGGLPYEVRPTVIPEDGLALDGLIPGWQEGSRLYAFPTKHSARSQGYRFELSRAGKFHPERALALAVPQKRWRELQHGKTVTLENGAVIFPHDVMGDARRGLSVVFSGDTSPCRSLTEAARDADLFLCEGTYGDNADAALAHSRGHSTYADAARTAAEASAKRLWLLHFSQSMTDPKEYLPNAEALFPAAVCGEDGMRVILRFEE